MNVIKPILILIASVFATMFTLVALSYLEVAIYAYLINPGHEEVFYQEHAQITAPWVSGIAGFFVFYAASRWILSRYLSRMFVAIGYPAAYLMIDFLVVLAVASVDWSVFIWVMIAANAPKWIGAWFGARHAVSDRTGSA